MDGEERRKELLKLLEEGKSPVSGNRLAETFRVSRQVIVQDIALLRASNKNIISTTKGYLLYEEEEGKAKRVFGVWHTNEQIEDELNTFVDFGGRVLDVVVEHEIYGAISVDLILRNRAEVKEFVRKVENETTVPLMGLTKGAHFHTVEAESEEVLNQIEEELRKKGYLISE